MLEARRTHDGTLGGCRADDTDFNIPVCGVVGGSIVVSGPKIGWWWAKCPRLPHTRRRYLAQTFGRLLIGRLTSGSSAGVARLASAIAGS